MNAIHIIMATSTSANPHNSPNERIETIVRKRKISALTFLIFGILLIIAGSLLASFESQRFSFSFILFGVIGIIFAFMYWVSAQKILSALRKFNAERIRQANLNAQNSGAYYFNNGNLVRYISPNHVDLPSYEQSTLSHTEIPPSYDEAIKTKSNDCSNNVSIEQCSSMPIRSISLSIDQSTNFNTTATTDNKQSTTDSSSRSQ